MRERVERKAARDKSWAEFGASLARIKKVVDDAIAEGLKTLTPEEFSQRLKTLESQSDADHLHWCACRIGKACNCRSQSDRSAERG